MAKWIAGIGAVLLLLIAVLFIQTDRQLREEINEVRTVDIPATEVERVEPVADRVPDAPPAVPPTIPPPPPPAAPEPPAEEAEPVDPALIPEEPEPAPPEEPIEEAVIPEEEPAVMADPARDPWRPSARVAPDEEDRRLPYRWLDEVQEQQPGFVDPGRVDPRSPTGDPILADPPPTGPPSGWYE